MVLCDGLMTSSVLSIGSIVAARVLGELYSRAIPSGVQYALLCSIPYSGFSNFLGQLYSSPFKETLGKGLMKC